MDHEEAFEKFRAATAQVLSVDESAVVPGARFQEDLKADSLDLAELVMALEESFGITIEESEIEGVETVDQAFALVTNKL